MVDEEQPLRNGVILEAAFIDPAYNWPPADGEGKNAIELQASSALLDEDQEAAAIEEQVRSFTEGEKSSAAGAASKGARALAAKNAAKKNGGGLFACCRKADDQVLDTASPGGDGSAAASRSAAIAAGNARKQAMKDKAASSKKKKQDRHQRVPEGMLVYKLDTANHKVELLSRPHAKTDMDSLMTSMVVARADPDPNTRRGLKLTGIDGTEANLVACEQRTATSWLEAMDMMLGHGSRNKAATKAAKAAGLVGVAGAAGYATSQSSRQWGKGLKDKERDNIEEEYTNLAGYSNKLIRAGALPDQQGKGGTGGIYYSVEHNAADGVRGDEALESIAKRRAVIKDSWDFFRMICSLLRDKRKYDEIFRKMQHDPVYPYLNSMTGLNDPGDVEYENADKAVLQKDLSQYNRMSKTQVANALVKKAEDALPSLVEICKALAGSLGMEEVGVGPIKEAGTAIRKAEKKYHGDLLKVTDYCRALLVVKDFPTLLALLELARDSFGPLIRRVKLSTLKSDKNPLAGGYRDCKINLELKDHICEIQVHVWPMWTVCGVDGFRHYRHCLEYSTDSFTDPYDALDGLERKTIAELIVMAEEAVADIPLDNLEWYHEKFILDYFAETGLFMKHGNHVWAETTLRHLIKLRCEAPEIGPNHHETMILNGYLEQCLREQGKAGEADEIKDKMAKYEEMKEEEKKEAEVSMWDSIMNAPTDAYDAIMDPNKKEREEEEALRKEVKQSKKHWRKIRQEKFSFLDSASHSAARSEEKKD